MMQIHNLLSPCLHYGNKNYTFKNCNKRRTRSNISRITFLNMTIVVHLYKSRQTLAFKMLAFKKSRILPGNSSRSSVVLADLPLDVRQPGPQIFAPLLFDLIVGGLQSRREKTTINFGSKNDLGKFDYQSLTFLRFFSLVNSSIAS